MHVLPVLRRLEQKYAGVLVVVGVHSAKFPTEKQTENVREAVLRYGVDHPVVNDRDFLVWQQYAARAWPTIVFVDPEGKFIGRHEGEIPFDSLDELVAQMVATFDGAGLLDRRPIRLQPERERMPEHAILFPGKLVVDAPGGRIFIADSGHHRLVVADLDGRIHRVVGEGEPGLRDGTFESVRFNGPQGIALVGDRLFVADTENHALRMVDLSTESVFTIAGTGQQATRYHTGGRARSVALSSPWDVTHYDGTLYVAMAGFHQIWRLDLAQGEIGVHAGSGHEGIQDGPLRQAWLAQPSGIVNDGHRLYFADSETSAIRMADLAESGAVQTIVGVGLFEFGDADGVGDAARLQHPLALDVADHILYVADTYNNKIKRVYPATRVAETFAGSGAEGRRDGPALGAQFDEPGGLCLADGKLYVADTNNHAIRVVDTLSGEVSTVRVRWA